MAVETFTYINSLDPNLPASSDGLVEGDNHIRGLKLATKQSFPNVTGAVTSTHTQLSNPILATTIAADKVPFYNSTTTASTLDAGATGKALLASANATVAINTLDLDNRYSRVGVPITQSITTNAVVQAAQFTVSSTAPTILFADSNWGNRTILHNDGLIGFVKSDGNWAMHSNNDGTLKVYGEVQATDLILTSDPLLKTDI
ncbi:hypothetical protein [Bosea sp. TAF32]|uniref:hypothetical protein n=1 Tax=Bosea sp. TAF32 TaxID=3237482 RepID=UPI003F91A5A4